MACGCAIAHGEHLAEACFAAHHVLVGFGRTPVTKLKLRCLESMEVPEGQSITERLPRMSVIPGTCGGSAAAPCFSLKLVNWHEPRRCQRSTPTVAAENSVRVLPWHSIPLASESRSKPHPHHSLSEHPQPISAAVVEHSAIEQTQGAIRAPLKVDRSQSDKSQDCLALLLQR